ncbi:hypothetical protein LTS18_006770 [Coniosporium uncinatum]|uniref:Uncharacterized protein n=1 Tax=Coniosporium uncinatum TaxID=93489 RepID=A0ACC3DQD7_9PEZI|nr:hypothetical protein LTS18_006770 [Coniosporium uncinatum]
MPGSPAIEMQLDSIDSGIGQSGMEYNAQHFRDSSEEKDGQNLTPAQSRRKAQNRAAQRAFRERKERHVKDLEAKLTALESSATTLATDNERLKLALQRARTENEILRATTTPSASRKSSPHSRNPSDSPMNGHAEPSDPRYSIAASAAWPSSVSPSSSPSAAGHPSNTSANWRDSGPGQLLPASATWDLIQSHELVRKGLVDIADVCERLKSSAQCDGQGPVFCEREVWRAVEEGRRGGGDELI